MKIPSRFSAIAIAPLAIVVLVFMMLFSTNQSANATPAATPAASANATSPNAAPDPDPQSQIISCSSDNMRRNYCAADVRGGVQLVKQRSDSPCIFNHTWGFINGRGIWVDRGCRADFEVGRVPY